MLIFTKTAELQAHLRTLKSQHKTLGFVPTMGALHLGHLSLISASKKLCEYTICSVFVNPKQFNDQLDLEKYPRMPEMDARMLENALCDILFMPEVEEVYGSEKVPNYSFGYLDQILEGEHRPGHFNGVAQVVKRLFEIVEPDKAFFGSKDYQQVMIVKALVQQTHSSVEIIACPILREHDGLAMSSRNTLLSAQERAAAGNIPRLMHESKHIAITSSVEEAKQFITAALKKIPEIRLEYFEICDAHTLLPATSIETKQKCIALIAAFVGKTRLIDNLNLN